MTVVPGYFDLSKEQKQFRALLLNCPSVSPYWDFERCECDIPALKVRMKTMSHGERVLAQFFLAVWSGENQHGFDLIEATKILDADSLLLIEQWIAEPFFP